MLKTLLILCLSIFILEANIYRKSNINVVIDKARSLMWTDDKNSVLLRYTHQDATKYCQNLKHAGYKGWRLPTIKEIETIVNKKRVGNINKAFKYHLMDDYWASKSHWRTLWFYADYMFFESGTPYYDSRHKKKFFRCIREIN